LLPAEIRRFILTSIPSVPYLEALLLLHSEPFTGWTAAALARRLYIGEKDAQSLLEQLHNAHIAKIDDDLEGFCYASAVDDLRTLINKLAALYSKDLLEITHLIHSKTDRKAQQFADAFKLRKDS
jgi:hypothetical protein